MNIKKYIAILLGLMLLSAPISYAQEDASDSVSFVTGMVTGMAPDALSIRWEDGLVYTFCVADRVDTSRLTGPLGVGRVITLYYSGQVDWGSSDASQASVVAIENGSLEYPYGTLIYDPAQSPQCLQLDLDQDGMIDMLSLDTVDGEAALSVNGTTCSDPLSPCFLMVCDLDTEDGALDIFAAEQLQPMDFFTTRLQYKNRQLHTAGRLEGMASDYLDGYVAVVEKIPLFGAEFFAEMYYCLDESGQLNRDEDSMWNLCRDVDDVPFVLTQDLPVALLTDEGEADSTLPAGSKLYLTAADGECAVWFETEDGQIGWFVTDASLNLFDIPTSPANQPPYFP